MFDKYIIKRVVAACHQTIIINLMQLAEQSLKLVTVFKEASRNLL
jgi:hypothetical protein